MVLSHLIIVQIDTYIVIYIHTHHQELGVGDVHFS